jgi:ABC-2 type transport system ATP-binding protein
MAAVLRTYRLGKTIDGKTLVSDVNMTLRKGEIYGFLGQNGAGKTTVMKMIAGILRPTEGEVELFGKPLQAGDTEPLKRMGSIIEYPIFYERLTALENLELHCAYMGYYNKKAIGEALEMVNLTGVEGKPVKQFSLGMKQRLGIARAIVTKPELLLFDEPINGLDPGGIRDMRNLFTMLSKEFGITILISSHILGEIEHIADTVGVIHQGRMVKQVSMEELRRTRHDYIEIATREVEKASYVLADRLNVTNMKVAGNHVIRVYDADVQQSELVKALAMSDVPVDSIVRKQHSLEDYFFHLLNGGDLHA